MVKNHLCQNLQHNSYSTVKQVSKVKSTVNLKTHVPIKSRKSRNHSMETTLGLLRMASCNVKRINANRKIQKVRSIKIAGKEIP